MKRKTVIILCCVFCLTLSCNQPLDLENFESDRQEEEWEDSESVPVQAETQSPALEENESPQDEDYTYDLSTLDKFSLWTGETQLRGANIYQRKVYPELDGPDFFGPGPLGPPFEQADFDALANLGANYVNISHRGLFSETPPYEVDLDAQENLDRLLTMIEKADMFAVISFRTGPGRSEFTFFWDEVGSWFNKSYLNDSVWGDEEAQAAWAVMWQYAAERYKDNPVVVGFDLMVEPNSNEVGSHAKNDLLDIWDPEEFYDQYEGSLYDWNQFYPEITASIRTVDEETPILVGGLGYSAVNWLPYLVPTNDPRTVYVVHQYAPYVYTHQEARNIQISYPDIADLDYDDQPDDFDKSWLDSILEPVDTFKNQHNAPIAINEFGPVRYVPGAAQYLEDHMQLMEDRGINYALWVWDPDWYPIHDELDHFTFRFGDDPNRHELDPESELTIAIQKYWQKNTIRPSDFRIEESEKISEDMADEESDKTAGNILLNVNTWLYQIQNINEPVSVQALTDSQVDMLVLEPTRTDWSSDDRHFDTAGLIQSIKTAYKEKDLKEPLIIAYIDIGEAEDWRWYWQWSNEWDCTPPIPDDWPAYILACDPDGWGGNYPVAYWHQSWKDIIIYGTDSLPEENIPYTSTLDEVLQSGFDGIYLDWVEAFEDDHVIQAAKIEGRNPAEEMVIFIEEMRSYARDQDEDFLIIQQNAAGLINHAPEIINQIDGIAQEGIWYEGIASDDWEDSKGCDELVDETTTDQYLLNLSKYQASGLPVFAVEYACDFAEIAHENASTYDFIPYTSRRSLSEISDTNKIE